MGDLRTPEVEALLDVMCKMTDKDEMYALFVDLFTIREIRETSQRLSVAHLLDQGKPYTAIAKATGASATTIARVSKALNYGSGGYRRALDILQSDGAGDAASADDAASSAGETADTTGAENKGTKQAVGAEGTGATAPSDGATAEAAAAASATDESAAGMATSATPAGRA
jgi:TrpR-related protein YerC/YecD